MATSMRWLLLVSLTCTAASCKHKAPPQAEALASSLPPITVKPGMKALYTYADASGSFATTSELDKVPEEKRAWVRVVDLDQKPNERQDHELVYVADLREPRDDGTYPYVVLPRDAFERAASGRLPASDARAQNPTQGDVIVYGTSWCPACRQARAYLTKKGIPFVDKDVEKDAAAAQELMAKAKAAGIPATGVPIIDVRGTLIPGFDAGRIDALLGEKK